MTEFRVFKDAVAAQFERMKKHPLFRTGAEKDALWETYLAAFPPGTNPIYRKRREYDCSSCRQFIRAVGNVVAVVDGRLETLWDTRVQNEPAYQTVSAAMAELVRAKPIADVFLHFEPTAGTDKSFEEISGSDFTTWNHFFVNVPKEYVKKRKDIPALLSGPRADHDVLLRSLSELTDDAVDTALELIAQNSLYRGAEFKGLLDEFRALKEAFGKLSTDADRDLFAWTARASGAISRIRNSAIGTLLVNLSGGMDLEAAVRAFEAVMAPSNYKRTTALVSKAMIEKAKTEIGDLGLTSALERRFANLRDITANNILFADRTARKSMGDVFDDLTATASAKKRKNLDKVEEVPVEKFIASILPHVDTVEVMFENRHAGNLVSLIAPADPTAGALFKWPNRFSWSYAGDVADSIKERVKKAGGNVEGDVCCRLAWNNTDDLDFHMREPSGYEILFTNRRVRSPCGGMLDVDANGIDGVRSDPAENIFYADKRRMGDGLYKLWVHQYAKRQTKNVGFEVEIDVGGVIHHFVYEKAVRQGETVHVADIHVQSGEVVVSGALPSTQAARTLWGIPTETFHMVSVLLLSPNHWDEKAVGNKHYFFMLEGCKNAERARGFFNEFLKEDLREHRKVLELVGSKIQIPDSDDQLSGLGFSSTQKGSLLCRVRGNFTRAVKIIF